MSNFMSLLFLALVFFQGCNLEDSHKTSVDNGWVEQPKPLEKVAADSAFLHQVSDDKIAGQNRPATGVFKDPETGNMYQLNSGWRIMPRQSKSGALAKTSGLIQTWTDQTGQIETRIYQCVTPSAAQHQSLACQVESGFVAVGGGAYVDYGSGAGALLTESRIADAGDASSAFVTWLASSKDHNYPCPHILSVYVIGMRLKDNYGSYMDPSILRSKLSLHKYTSSPADHSSYFTTTISETSVSMGARTNYSGAGFLLTASYSYISPTYYDHMRTSYIYAGGKDHIVSDPGTVTLYSIDFVPDPFTNYMTLPNFGRLGFDGRQCDGSSVSTGVAVTYCDVQPGYVLVGMGGQAFATSGTGRLLFGIKPTGTYSGQIGIYSKDHRSVSGGYNHASLTEAAKW